MPVLSYLDSVDSEGGPFLLADATDARNWQGTEGDGSDYERIDDILLDGMPAAMIPLGDGQALLWEPDGPGTGDVYYKDGRFMLLRVWINNPSDLNAVDALSDLPLVNATHLGELEIASGTVAVLWTPESGESISLLDDVSTNSQSPGGAETDFSGLLVRVPKGRYSCLHDEVTIGSESARRCHLVLTP